MKVTKRGINSLIDYSKLRGNKDLAERLPSEEAVYVHEKSRRQYNNKRGIEQEQKAENKSSESQTECRRRLTPLFHFKSHCLFCSKKVGCDKKQWHLAQTLDIREIILKECQQKIEKIENDTWAIEVKKRILGCIDFVASEAHYHRDCQVRFSVGKNLLPQNQNGGRNRNEQILYYFRKTYEWIESETEIHTVTQFRDKIREYCAIMVPRTICIVSNI